MMWYECAMDTVVNKAFVAFGNGIFLCLGCKGREGNGKEYR